MPFQYQLHPPNPLIVSCVPAWFGLAQMYERTSESTLLPNCVPTYNWIYSAAEHCEAITRLHGFVKQVCTPEQFFNFYLGGFLGVEVVLSSWWEG